MEGHQAMWLNANLKTQYKTGLSALHLQELCKV